MNTNIIEPVIKQKWWIVAICFLCVVGIGIAIFIGVKTKNSKDTDDIETAGTEAIEEATSEETTEPTIEETLPRATFATIPKVTEETTEPTVKETVTEKNETKPAETTKPQTTKPMETTEATEVTEAPTTSPESNPTIESTEPIETTESTDPEPTETTSEPVDEPESDENESEVDNYSLELLACAIYTEAGGDAECDDCRRRVADVILNRVADERFPDSIYGVLTQPGQYAGGTRWPSRANNSGEAYAVERAYRIAEEVLNGQHSDIYGNGYVWQAQFVQGSSGFWCCGTYFGKG